MTCIYICIVVQLLLSFNYRSGYTSIVCIYYFAHSYRHLIIVYKYVHHDFRIYKYP